MIILIRRVTLVDPLLLMESKLVSYLGELDVPNLENQECTLKWLFYVVTLIVANFDMNMIFDGE